MLYIIFCYSLNIYLCSKHGTAYLYKRDTFQSLTEYNSTTCVLHEMSHGGMYNDVQKAEINCGRVCGGHVNCASFGKVDENSCLVCMEKLLETSSTQFKLWEGVDTPLSDVWLKESTDYFYIGFNHSDQELNVDQDNIHSFVDITPVPYMSRIVSFRYNAGEVHREMRFGI